MDHKKKERLLNSILLPLAAVLVLGAMIYGFGGQSCPHGTGECESSQTEPVDEHSQDTEHSHHEN